MNRALNVANPEQEPVSLRQADSRRLELSASLVAGIYALQNLGPEFRGTGSCRGAKSQPNERTDPVVVNDEVRRRCRGRPFLQKRRRERDRIPDTRTVSSWLIASES